VVCINSRTYIHTYIHTYLHAYTYIHTYMHINIYILTCIHIHTYTHLSGLSRLNNRLRECQDRVLNIDSFNYFKCYGDSIFPQQDCIRSSHKGKNLPDRLVQENNKLKKVRVCVEWHYGDLCSLFPFLDYYKNHKILQNNCGLLYFAASLLRNCHCCLYGNNTSKYFNLQGPSIKTFMRHSE
jgi:hypothetical protein